MSWVKKPKLRQQAAILALVFFCGVSQHAPAFAWQPWKWKPEGGGQVEQRESSGSLVEHQLEAEQSETGMDADDMPVKLANGTLLLKGRVTFRVPKGTSVKLKLAQVPTTGLHLMDRDLDGNLHPARVDQEITARVSEDLFVGDNKVLPEGTVFYGRVTQVYPPRRLGRPGHLVLEFDRLTTPDGRSFAFKAEANNFRQSTLGSKARGLGIIAAHAAGGAVLGALIAYQIFGLEKTIALHGYNIAGGAAAGALGGTAAALLRRGSKAVLEPGDDLNMEIDRDLLLPAAIESESRMPPPRLEGLEINILRSKVRKDGLGGYLATYQAQIINNTERRLDSLGLFLEDGSGNRLLLAEGADQDAELIFHVEPYSIKQVKLSFNLEFPKLKRKLVWTDQATRQDLHVIPLP